MRVVRLIMILKLAGITLQVINMRERAINRILNLTNVYSREELESIEDTLELVALSYDVKKIKNEKI